MSNKFVSFLKQFGLDAMKGLQIFMGIEPLASGLLQASLPSASIKLDSIAAMATEALKVEAGFAAAFGSANPTGAAKFAALVPQVQQIVLSSEAMVGKKVGDEALFTKAMQEYAQATADLLNSLKPSVSTTDSANAPAVPSANLPVPPVVPQPPA